MIGAGIGAGGDWAVYLGDFRFEPTTRRLWHGAGEVALRPKTAAVLALLVARAGEVVPKGELLSAVWPGGFVGDTALSVCINELRNVFSDDARHPRFIATAHRRGYQLVVEVSFAPQDGGGKVPLFVGRSQALATLGGWWEEARGGRRQLGFVAAPAGVGKTALVDAFVRGSLGNGPALVGRGQCVEQVGPREPYFPMLQALAGLCRGPGGAVAREVLHRYAPSWVAQLPGTLDDRELDALVRQVGGPGTPRMLREFAVAVEELAARRPLVLVLEDLHDGDRASVELVSYLAQRREPARLLLLGTYRPEKVIAFAHPMHQMVRDLSSRALCGHLVLELLSEAEVSAYLSARLAPQIPSTQLVADVHHRTEGNALFVVALYEHLVSIGGLVMEGGTVTTPAGLGSLGVPDEVRLMLERQVDALDEPDRGLLLAASAAGVEFAAEAVCAGLGGSLSGAELSGADVEERCDRLARQGALLRPAGTAEWPDGTQSARYRFTHEMYREVVYQRLSPARRAELHRRVGSRVAAGYGHRAAEVAPELALHFERGREYAAAVAHLGAAAEAAVTRSAYPEAHEYACRGLQLLARVVDEVERSRLELVLLRTEVVSAAATWGWRAPRAREDCQRLADLAIDNGDTPALLAALLGLHNTAMMDGDSGGMEAVVQRVDALAAGDPDPAVLMVDDLLNLRADSRDGRYALVWQRARRVLETYGPAEHGSLAVIVGDQFDVAADLYGGVALWCLGHPDQGRRHADDGLDGARGQEIPAGLARALWFAAVVHLLCGDGARVHDLAAELEGICARHELGVWGAGADVLLGWAAAKLGDTSAGLDQLRHGAAAWERLAGIGDTFHQRLVAELCLAAGDAAGGLAAVRSGLAAVARTGYVQSEPELLRVQGELLLLAGAEHAGEAERSMLRAEKMAAGQGARSFQLRAATSLARLWHELGRSEEAAALLGSIYTSFTEGHGTRDLVVAQALLAGMRGGDP